MSSLEIPQEFDRSAYRDLERTDESAVFLYKSACEILGVADLSDKDVLDVGCGTKFSGAILNHGLPIRSYTGVDVYGKMIDFLRENVSDPRFEYHHVDVRNELYNPDAPPMTTEVDFGVGEHTFDVIWLFSVFTHLAPHDYTTMLKVLRRYIAPEGTLTYTLFVDEFTEGGYGYMDRIAQGLAQQPSEELARHLQGPRDVQPFVDVDPAHPLRCAMYSREYAFELIDGTGWKPVQLREPHEFAQHQFVCVPV